MNMIATDGFAFLNLDDPICAWNVVRGTLVSAGFGESSEGFLSAWSASLLKNHTKPCLTTELLLEEVRRQVSPQKISRLRGIFCFLEQSSAVRALSWGLHHTSMENLAELSLQRIAQQDRLDSNWITYAKTNGPFNTTWMKQYWLGEPMPGDEPIWETIVEGRVFVLGTELRRRAFDVVQKSFPESLGLLEISRAAAWVDSDLGNISASLVSEEENVSVQYFMDFRDANDPEFLRCLQQENAIVNYHLIRPHIENEQLGVTPDLRPYEFSRLKSQMPYVGPALESS